MEQRVIDCEGDQKKMLSLKHSLLGSKKSTVFPEYTSSFTSAYKTGHSCETALLRVYLYW